MNTTISTGHANLDSILGGGWPIGPGTWQPEGLGSEPRTYPAARISEVYGSKDSGRSAIACSTIATALAARKRVLAVNCEMEDLAVAGALWMHRDQLEVASCQDLDTISMQLRSDDAQFFDLIVLDVRHIETTERSSRRLSQLLKHVASWQRNVCLLIVSGDRPVFGRSAVSYATLQAPRFYAWTRLHVRRVSPINAGAVLCKAKTVKNKQAAPFQSCSFEVSDGVLRP